MLKKVLMVGIILIVIAGAGWGATTLDDISKSVQQLQIGQARLEERLGSQIGGLQTIVTTLFVALFAALVGLYYFVFDISRTLRTPKEERVAKLEEMREKLKDFLAEVAEKIHIQKPIL